MRKQYVYVLPAAVLIVLTIVVSLIFYSTLNVWSYVLLAASFAASLSLAAVGKTRGLKRPASKMFIHSAPDVSQKVSRLKCV